ncbi:MAG: glycosyltransferase family 2 protein [Sphingobacteriales bacterium]|nr:MAG: glycosyltransferase family 2 protein [Sphingobacteriales bacterium]
MIKISVVIITLNEERNIARCLESVRKVADEIVVIDSASTDRTADIAKQYGARVIIQPFLGYVEQHNFANKQASNDWLLVLDADEALSEQLEKSILAVKKQPTHNAYKFARLTNYCGTWIKHSGWYPDKKIRLIDRRTGSWAGHKVHEYWQQEQGSLGELKGDLLHYSFYTISQHIKQTEKFSELWALAAAENGKDCSILKVWLAPKWSFFSNYVLKLGFLDGYAGYLVCKYTALYTMIKYAKLRQYARWLHEGKDFEGKPKSV